eukprot:Pgem_evm1s10994
MKFKNKLNKYSESLNSHSYGKPKNKEEEQNNLKRARQDKTTGERILLKAILSFLPHVNKKKNTIDFLFLNQQQQQQQQQIITNNGKQQQRSQSQSQQKQEQNQNKTKNNKIYQSSFSMTPPIFISLFGAPGIYHGYGFHM